MRLEGNEIQVDVRRLPMESMRWATRAAANQMRPRDRFDGTLGALGLALSFTSDRSPLRLHRASACAPHATLLSTTLYPTIWLGSASVSRELAHSTAQGPSCRLKVGSWAKPYGRGGLAFAR
jgi:hypothetical protein